ncbi:unnamed protein product [Amoebophrya sp. A25]|nr:unnamed protein product [Amoebophrya sp. A25]|eukprot:GSA25T00000809001.1
MFIVPEQSARAQNFTRTVPQPYNSEEFDPFLANLYAYTNFPTEQAGPGSCYTVESLKDKVRVNRKEGSELKQSSATLKGLVSNPVRYIRISTGPSTSLGFGSTSRSRMAPTKQSPMDKVFKWDTSTTNDDIGRTWSFSGGSRPIRQPRGRRMREQLAGVPAAESSNPLGGGQNVLTTYDPAMRTMSPQVPQVFKPVERVDGVNLASSVVTGSGSAQQVRKPMAQRVDLLQRSSAARRPSPILPQNDDRLTNRGIQRIWTFSGGTQLLRPGVNDWRPVPEDMPRIPGLDAPLDHTARVLDFGGDEEEGDSTRSRSRSARGGGEDIPLLVGDKSYSGLVSREIKRGYDIVTLQASPIEAENYSARKNVNMKAMDTSVKSMASKSTTTASLNTASATLQQNHQIDIVDDYMLSPPAVQAPKEAPPPASKIREKSAPPAMSANNKVISVVEVNVEDVLETFPLEKAAEVQYLLSEESLGKLVERARSAPPQRRSNYDQDAPFKTNPTMKAVSGSKVAGSTSTSLFMPQSQSGGLQRLQAVSELQQDSNGFASFAGKSTAEFLGRESSSGKRTYTKYEQQRLKDGSLMLRPHGTGKAMVGQPMRGLPPLPFSGIENSEYSPPSALRPGPNTYMTSEYKTTFVHPRKMTPPPRPSPGGKRNVANYMKQVELIEAQRARIQEILLENAGSSTYRSGQSGQAVAVDSSPVDTSQEVAASVETQVVAGNSAAKDTEAEQRATEAEALAASSAQGRGDAGSSGSPFYRPGMNFDTSDNENPYVFGSLAEPRSRERRHVPELYAVTSARTVVPRLAGLATPRDNPKWYPYPSNNYDPSVAYYVQQRPFAWANVRSGNNLHPQEQDVASTVPLSKRTTSSGDSAPRAPPPPTSVRVMPETPASTKDVRTVAPQTPVKDSSAQTMQENPVQQGGFDLVIIAGTPAKNKRQEVSVVGDTIETTGASSSQVVDQSGMDTGRGTIDTPAGKAPESPQGFPADLVDAEIRSSIKPKDTEDGFEELAFAGKSFSKTKYAAKPELESEASGRPPAWEELPRGVIEADLVDTNYQKNKYSRTSSKASRADLPSGFHATPREEFGSVGRFFLFGKTDDQPRSWMAKLRQQEEEARGEPFFPKWDIKGMNEENE